MTNVALFAEPLKGAPNLIDNQKPSIHGWEKRFLLWSVLKSGQLNKMEGETQVKKIFSEHLRIWNAISLKQSISSKCCWMVILPVPFVLEMEKSRTQCWPSILNCPSEQFCLQSSSTVSSSVGGNVIRNNWARAANSKNKHDIYQEKCPWLTRLNNFNLHCRLLYNMLPQ